MNAAERKQLQEWMRRLADGDRSAFRPMFSASWPLLRQFARRLLQGAPEAEDAAQEALVKVFAQAADFDAERDALTWMISLVVYECRTVRKSKARRRETPEIPSVASLQTPESQLAEQQVLQAADELMGDLRPEDVEVIRAAWSGTSRPDVSPATFRKRLQRTLERVRLAWRLRHGSD